LKHQSAAAPSVETVEVTKVYKVGHVDYPALRGVNLTIERGELTSIIGQWKIDTTQHHRGS
jgi:ABC-type nitrate/sulfonate/bicarbonate transport system ATPase subunit